MATQVNHYRDKLMNRNSLIFSHGGLMLLSLLSLSSFAFETTVFRNVRVFDGDQLLPKATVVVVDGKVHSVTNKFEKQLIPNDSSPIVVVEGEGKTLMPGLIDSHTHVFSKAMLVRSLDFGVTTSVDMFMLDLNLMRALQLEQQAHEIYDRAEFLSAGIAVTAPGGHGTQFGVEIPTLALDSDVDAFVRARVDEGSQFIKLIIDDFSVVDFNLPTLTVSQVESTVKAAQKYNKLAVVHSRDIEGYLAAVESGADGIAHSLSELRPTKELMTLMKEKGTFVISTLTMREGTVGGLGGKVFAESLPINDILNEREKASLSRSRFKIPRGITDLSIALDTIGEMHANGTMIVAGTDAPNPGTTHGASMHRELELLVKAGLTPLEALKSATSNGANAFGLSNRGSIKPGKQADLLLVAGNPELDITDTRNIIGVWKSGRQHLLLSPQVGYMVSLKNGGWKKIER